MCNEPYYEDKIENNQNDAKNFINCIKLLIYVLIAVCGLAYFIYEVVFQSSFNNMNKYALAFSIIILVLFVFCLSFLIINEVFYLQNGKKNKIINLIISIFALLLFTFYGLNIIINYTETISYYKDLISRLTEAGQNDIVVTYKDLISKYTKTLVFTSVFFFALITLFIYNIIKNIYLISRSTNNENYYID